MQARALIGLGGAAAAVVAGLVLFWPDGRRSPARPPGPGVPAEPAVVTPGAPATPGSARPPGPVGPVAPSPPVRLEPPAGPGPLEPSAAPAFADEARDPAWADAHERELALRLRAVEEALEARGVAVQLGAPECRRSLCRVVIGAADSAALGKAYGLLESEDGLYGWADALLLERVVTGDDGRVETGVIAQFGRDGSE